MYRIAFHLLFFAWAVPLVLTAPALALECTAPATWTERTICGSDELTGLDRRITRLEAELAAAADARFRSALATDARTWRQVRDACRQAEYPQACMEQRHYARLDTLSHLTSLIIGPRLFGDPLRGCWQFSETDTEAQACLDAKLADSLAGLAIAGAGVREALAARDRAANSAGDALALFDAAEAAFATHEKAACLSEAAALGEGRGRALGGTACRIRLVRERAVDIMRLMPNLAAPWTTGIGAAQQEIDACLAEAGPAAVIGITHRSDNRRIRIRTAAGERQDCTPAGAPAPELVPVADGDAAPDEALARYVSGPEHVAAPMCGLVKPVLDPAGAVIGQLIVDGC